MNSHENLRAALREIKISFELLSVVTADDLAALPDEGGWHVASEVMTAAEYHQTAKATLRGEEE